jgi:hypothetical protein
MYGEAFGPRTLIGGVLILGASFAVMRAPI